MNEPTPSDVHCNGLAPDAVPLQARWHVYLLECADGTLYCGVTTNLSRRLAQHNGDRHGGARYTRTRRPVRLAASISCADRPAALRLEDRIKKLPRAQKISFFSEHASIECRL